MEQDDVHLAIGKYGVEDVVVVADLFPIGAIRGPETVVFLNSGSESVIPSRYRHYGMSLTHEPSDASSRHENNRSSAASSSNTPACIQLYGCSCCGSRIPSLG